MNHAAQGSWAATAVMSQALARMEERALRLGIPFVLVFFLVGITAVLVYFTILYSRRRNPKPEDVHGHTLLEIVWTVIPTILAFGMFWYGWVGYQFMKTAPEDALEVTVTGRMCPIGSSNEIRWSSKSMPAA